MWIFRGFEIRESMSVPWALGWGCLALGLILDGILGFGAWAILSGLGGLTVLVVGSSELVARHRKQL
jgi:hypothetical protein